MTHVFSGQGGGQTVQEARDTPPSVFILPGCTHSTLRLRGPFFCGCEASEIEMGAGWR
jgi:hypothetical protein